MKLLDLYINGFGKFHNQSVSFEDGLNIVYGKNEAGKSTLHTFIRGMLFGIERQRGRAARTDLYSKYEPWENSGTYEGRLRVESMGNVYRIERSFQKNNKEFVIVNETLGKEVEPSKAFMDQLLSGLSETAYNNTISIGQLKSATEAGMVAELKNYIANMNTSGNMALNITKATAYLKNQRKQLEKQMMPEAAKTYASLLGEIKNIEKEISSPEFENQMQSCQSMRQQVKSLIEVKQQERDDLTSRVERGRQMLADYQFTDNASVTAYQKDVEKVYADYEAAKKAGARKSRTVLSIFSLILATALLGGAGFLYYLYRQQQILPCAVMAGFSAFLYLAGAVLFLKGKHYQKELELSSGMLTEVFTRHLGDNTISREAMNAFTARMEEFVRLGEMIVSSESMIREQMEEIDSLREKQNTCSEVIEKQQRTQWELEKKLEHLSNCKDQASALKRILRENERLREEMASIDLALETMTELSSSIRDSFGLYLNKTASSLIEGITGGIYSSMSIDENLNIFLNTRAKLIPLEQASSGTMDQVYLALRLAAAKLIQTGEDDMPLIFDDSFVLYDDDRLKTALKWLSKAYKGQIIVFTCHQREAQMLTANQIKYHLISM